MIYLSAQPDEYYFYWQLELQIFNFKSLKINLNELHILICYNENYGLSRDYKDFKRKYPNINIYTYSDTRKTKYYSSSIRPHVIAKHFERFSTLSKEILFYYDSDIIFSKLPNFQILVNDDAWYSSNTKDYTGASHIIDLAGEMIFNDMCGVVGISPKLVIDNDENAGGAQYVIKNVTSAFWKKVEADCEKVYMLLSVAENNLNSGSLEDQPFIQKWCTDMWVIWWNVLLLGKKFLVSNELDFCWATSPIEDWNSKSILHYTGNVERASKHLFRKNNYILHSPFQENLEDITEETCSFSLVQVIKDMNRVRAMQRKNIKDFTFLIPVKIDSTDRLKNLYASTSYLTKHFKTNIIVMEIDDQQRVDPTKFGNEIIYRFVKSKSPKLHRTRHNNDMIKMATTKFIVLYDTDVIITRQQINKSVKILKEGIFKSVSPYSGAFMNVDYLLREIFLKILDDKFLIDNFNKLEISSNRSYGGCLFLDRECYVSAGMENENLYSWGPDDIERVKRLEILGYKTMRIEGPLLHFDHERNINSGYKNGNDYEELMQTYLNICSMEKQELINHIKQWKWIKK